MGADHQNLGRAGRLTALMVTQHLNARGAAGDQRRPEAEHPP
jgi:hypothetical protein